MGIGIPAKRITEESFSDEHSSGYRGVGNCASSLVQGVEYYKDTKDEDKIPGLMHNNFGGYRVRDIEFVTAFDVDALKVGKDLSEAIGASQNNTIKFADVPNLASRCCVARLTTAWANTTAR